MVNVRDVTDQKDLYESKAKIKQLYEVVQRLLSELEHPLISVSKSAQKLFRG